MLGFGVAVADRRLRVRRRAAARSSSARPGPRSASCSPARRCARSRSLLPRPPRTPGALRGGWALAAFALLAVFTALSITWSLMPNDSWLEANRTLAYFAVLAGGLALGRLRARALERAARPAIAISAVALCRLVAADQGLPGRVRDRRDLRAPAAAVRLLEQRRPRRGARHPAAAVARRRAAPATPRSTRSPGPASASLIVCLMLAVLARRAAGGRRSALAIWLVGRPAAAARGGRCSAACWWRRVPLVAWAFAQDGLTGDNARDGAAHRRRPGLRRAAAAAARHADRRRPRGRLHLGATSRPAPQARARATPRARRRARRRPRGRDPAAGQRARRHRRAGLARPGTRRPTRRSPARPTARSG